MSSNKSIANIVVVFVAIVVIVACCDSNKDSENNTRIVAKMYKSINTREICPPRSKPKTQKGLKETEYKYYTRIYRVESRDEFDNCQVNEANNKANKQTVMVKCDDRQIESQMSDLPLYLFMSEFEERKEYFFLSVSSKDRVNGVCDDFVVRFSITVDLDDDQFFKILIYE